MLASRGVDFQPQDLQVLKVLMDSHWAARNNPFFLLFACVISQMMRYTVCLGIIDAMAQLEASLASIVEQEFNLLMNQLQLDRDEWRVYKHKLANYAASVSKLKHDWDLKRHKQSGKAADVFMKQQCLVSVYTKDCLLYTSDAADE